MRIFKVAEDEKCGGCNWRVSRLFVIAENEKSAKEFSKILDKKVERKGLCAECIIDLIMEEGYEIVKAE